MTTEVVLLYDMNGDFLGYTSARRVPNGVKLSSTNVWPDIKELQEQIDKANQSTLIKQHWPRTDDPEVQVLLNDPQFMPFEMTTAEVVDEENSYFVWDQVGADGKPTPEANLDRKASVLAYKTAQVPADPSKVQLRFKEAHEIVARRRAGLALQ